MKSREEEEKENFEILMKAAGNDPQALAAALKTMLAQGDDEGIEPSAEQKAKAKREQEMVEAARDILKMDKKRKF